MIAFVLLAAMATPKECLHIGPLYWEMGDANGTLEQGIKGSTVHSESLLPAGFASSWLFAAYAAETHPLDDVARDALRMTSGFSGMSPIVCAHGARTVAQCDQRAGGAVAGSKGRLFYNGGHLQHWAATHGLGPDSGDKLGEAVSSALQVPLSMQEPLPASAVYISGTAYGAFLRKLLKAELKLSSLLGQDAVSGALFSPAPASWRYSYGHFVEDDGTYSNPGRYGFYPWINGNTYGVVARRSSTPTALMDSVECGRALRKAFAEERK